MLSAERRVHRNDCDVRLKSVCHLILRCDSFSALITFRSATIMILFDGFWKNEQHRHGEIESMLKWYNNNYSNMKHLVRWLKYRRIADIWAPFVCAEDERNCWRNICSMFCSTFGKNTEGRMKTKQKQLFINSCLGSGQKVKIIFISKYIAIILKAFRGLTCEYNESPFDSL